MTLVERLREKANMYVEDILDEAADRIEALEKANLALDFGLREVIDADMRGEFTKIVEIAQAALGEAREALGEGKP